MDSVVGALAEDGSAPAGNQRFRVGVARRESPCEWPTVAQLYAAFLLDAECYYVDVAGNRSREVDNLRLAKPAAQ